MIEYLGDGTKVITNKDGDKIFLNEARMRKVRFDVVDPHGIEPHMHIEKWDSTINDWVDELGIHQFFPGKK